MKQYATLEEYADHVRQEAHTLMVALCRDLGPEHRTTLRVLDLLTESGTIVQQARMGREQAAGNYDLAALASVVNPSTASNSETPFEDD